MANLTLDVLVLTAGVAPSTSAKPPAPLTVDGFEMTVGTNHLGHFLMANLLLPELEKAPGNPRLVVTASQVLLLSSRETSIVCSAVLCDYFVLLTRLTRPRRSTTLRRQVAT